MRNSLSPALSSLARSTGVALVAALAAVAIFALAPFSSSGAASDNELAVVPESEVATPDGTRAVKEVVDRRTASSRTYLLENGRLLTQLFARDVNYRDDGGKWTPIDTSLVAAAGGGLKVAAAGIDLALPAHSDGQVRVADGSNWLEFGLRGAASRTPSVDGSTARYGGVLDGVDLKYAALGNGVKESLVLDDRGAPARFAFDLRAASGLHPVERPSGGVDLVGEDGRARMSLAAPYMVDAAGAASPAVDYQVERVANGWALEVSADEKWLAAPERRYPVEVDPTVYIGASPDCSLDASVPTTSLCSNDYLDVGWDGSNDHRSVLKFDVNSVVPADGHIETAYIGMYMRSKTSSASKDVGVYRLTRSWTSSASWNKYDGTNSWTTAGGDFDGAKLWDKSQIGTSPTGEYAYFGVTLLAQRWRDGTYSNHGLIVKDVQDTTTSNKLRFSSMDRTGTSEDPYMGITWDHRLGDQRQFTLERQSLSDRSELAVNVANGNLIYRGNDVNIAGTGLNLGVSSVYNSLGMWWEPLISGKQWNYSAGGGIFLWFGGGYDRVLFGPTGERKVFHGKPDGSFESPTGINATLETEGAGWKLTFDETEEVWHFNSDGDLASQEDHNGNEITYTYSAPMVLDEITDTQGRTITTGYDGNGMLHTLTDWSGRVWTYDYDAYANLTTYTDPDGEQTQFVYNGSDDLTSITDPRGKVTKLEYDGSSRITAIKRNYVSGTNTWTAKTSYAYSSATSPCSGSDVGKTVVTDPRNHDTTYCYDHEARVTKVVDQNGNTTSTTYTANSDIATITAPGSAVTTYGYDGDNNLESIARPAGEEAEYEYTDASHPSLPTLSTDPQGTSTALAYDTAGNTTTVADGGSPTQVEAGLEYNGEPTDDCTNDATTHAGTVRCAIDGNGNITEYGYDDDGNLTSITPESPLGDTTITYDSLSRTDTVEDGKGQTRTYTYDPLDRVTQIEYSNGDTIDYDYDENGNLLQRDDSVAGVSDYVYDALNRKTHDDLPSGDNDYGWDATSNLASLTDPGGTVNYGYDDGNRLTKLAEPGGACSGSVSLCTTFTYTSRDQRDTTTFPNTVVQDIDYDASDKPTRIQAYKPGSPAITLTDFTYDYTLPSTAEGTLLQSVIDKDNDKTIYGYDFLGRLTSAVEKASGGAGATLDDRSWTYDDASNRTRQVVNGTTTSYGYNAANELCWEYTGTSSNACGSPPGGASTYTYDANGNTTASSAGLALAYNIKDATTSWTPPGGSATTFAHAGTGQAERTSVGGTSQHNTKLGLTRSSSTEWTREPNGALISQNASGTRHYYLADHQGSTVGLTDGSGNLAQTYDYDAYGLMRSSSGSVSNPFLFTGEYRHSAADGGLYKIGTRYYQPGVGRWTQLDPLDQAGDLREANRYVYAATDPVNVTDPTGCAGTVKCVWNCLWANCNKLKIASKCGEKLAQSNAAVKLAICGIENCWQSAWCIKKYCFPGGGPKGGGPWWLPKIKLEWNLPKVL